jgi:phosphatidate cytidylyltransferase
VRTRIVSSVAVIIAGLLPTLLGGPIFATFMTVLAMTGYREYLGLAGHISKAIPRRSGMIGYAVLAALAVAALLGIGVTGLFSIVALAVALPVVAQLSHSAEAEGFAAWCLISCGSLYLGLPVFAAVALRETPGLVDSAWFVAMTEMLAIGWQAAPRGLAWALTVILATWVGDSAAYLTGRAFGRRKLAPRLSPNKTIEGGLGGLIGSLVVGGLAFLVFGLGAWWIGAFVGFVIGVAGQVGDLVESFLKRQAGVKDSGTLIPGHGGILDRIDALLFAFPAGFMLGAGLERLGLL